VRGAGPALALVVLPGLAAFAPAGRAADAVAGARDLWARGEPARAVEILEAERALRPRDPTVYLVLGSFYYNLGSAHRAAPVLAEGLEAEPGDPATLRSLRYFLGLSLTALHRLEEAAELFEAATGSDRGDALAPYGLGWVHARERRFEEAIAAFEVAVARGNENAAGDLRWARERLEMARALQAADRRATLLIAGAAVVSAASIFALARIVARSR